MTTYRQSEKPLHEYLRDHARRQPKKPALLWYGKALSYGELDRLSDAFAARLENLGVKQSDRVALFLNNCPQYVIAHFGIQKLGAIVCPCSPLFKSHELEYQLKDLGAEVILAADGLYPIVETVRAATALKHVFVTGYGELLPAAPSIDAPPELKQPRPAIPGSEDFLSVLAATATRPPTPTLDLDDVALITYTSGTAGLPKGAMLSYRNALFKTATAADSNDVRDSDVLLTIAPLYHIAGMLMGVDIPIYAGATAVLMHRFDPQATLQAISRHKVTWWYSIAPMNVACMQVPDAQTSYDFSSLRVNPATSFGITLTESLAEKWRSFTGGCPLYEAAYGLTETHTCDTYMPRDAIRWGTQGKIAPGVECRIVSPDTGAELPHGEMGEVVLRSPGVFKGYWNKPEATAATLRDSWLHTGDMGQLDADGYLTFSGRFKEMIKVSGYSVFPEEVEMMLIKHPAVAQAAVIGMPDSQKGEACKAVLVLRTGMHVSAEEIIAWARNNMSAYKVPKTVEFRDVLPATGAGKVLRRMLKQE